MEFSNWEPGRNSEIFKTSRDHATPLPPGRPLNVVDSHLYVFVLEAVHVAVDLKYL